MNVQDWLGADNQLGIDIWNKKYRHKDESFDEWLDRVSGGDDEVRQLIVEKKFLFGGRTLANRGIDNSGSFFNCYSYGFLDDNYEKILKGCTDIGLTFKAQGGQGVSFSKLRPKGTRIGEDYYSDGIVPFMKIYNEVTAGTSQGGCIHEDELVLTDTGYKKIKDILVGDNVYTKIGYVPVNVVFDKGEQEIYKVTTTKGYKIRTTKDHKFCYDGFNTKHLYDLKVGDNICIMAGKAEYSQFVQIAYLLAHFNANGSFTKGCDCGYITISNKHRHVIARIREAIQALGLEYRELNYKNENATRIVVTAELGRMLKSYGLKKINAYNLSVPDWIMYGNDDTILSYLAGCFDSDGNITNNGVKYTTVCKEYANQIAILMSRVGFFPSLSIEKRCGNKHDLYTIRDAIRNNITYIPSAKIEHANIKDVKNSRYTTPYTIDNTGMRIKGNLLKISRTTNIGLYTYLDQYDAPYAPMIFDEIVSIEPCGSAHVYDIGLEHEHLFDCNGFYVSNSRKGALMMSIDARHKEAETFIKIKSQAGEIEKANLSLEIDNEFMMAVKKYYVTGEVITLHEKRDYSGHIVEYDIIPIEIFKMLVDNCYDWGDPAALFVDRFRNYNLMEYDDEYNIETCNPCGEQPLAKNSACCLSSLNLSEFIIHPYTDDAHLDEEAFKKAVRVGIKALDILIDENYYRHPLKEQQEMSFNYRNVGLGIFGYASALMKLGMRYGSEQAQKFTDYVFNMMFRTAVFESNARAKELGTFPKYKECVLDSTIIKNHFSSEEIAMLKENGLRNCSLISIAPTGSLATMLGESGGCEPQFALKFTRRTVGMTNGEDRYYDVYCKTAKEYMQIHQTKELPDYFVGANDIPWKERVITQAIMQNHVDTAISSTVNLPNEATKEDIAQLYLLAWELGCKGITIFRDNCKKVGILTTDSASKPASEESTDIISRGDWAPKPQDTTYYERKLRIGCGSLLMFVGWSPSEQKIVDLFIKKSGQGGCEKLLETAAICMSAILRLGGSTHNIEKALRGVTSCPSFIASRKDGNQLSKGNHCGAAIINELNAFYNEMTNSVAPKKPVQATAPKPIINSKSNTSCPECGQPVRFEGGCVVCPNCGSSKC